MSPGRAVEVVALPKSDVRLQSQQHQDAKGLRKADFINESGQDLELKGLPLSLLRHEQVVTMINTCQLI